MAFTPKDPVNPGIPNNLTEKTEGQAGIPNNPTEKAPASPGIPNNPTEKAAQSPAVPNNPTEKAAQSPVAPRGLTEESATTPAIPNSPLAKSAALIPRTLTPLVCLNFAAGSYAQAGQPKTFDDLFTYSRASSATFINRRINRLGRYEYFLDTDYVGDVENLVTYSEQFDNGAWTKTNSTVSPSIELSPNGTRTAQKLIEDSSSGVNHFCLQDVSVVSGNDYTISVFAKAGENKLIQLTFGSAGFSNLNKANFDINTGVIGTVTDGIAKIKYAGDGWYECSFTSTADATVAAGGLIIGFINDLADSRLPSFNGDGESGFFIWGGQHTQSAKPLPYVKTTSAAVTGTFSESIRRHYDPVTGEALGVLAEGGSTNLQTYSEEINTANWSQGSGTLDSNDALAPDGTKTAAKYTATSNSSSSGAPIITLSTSTSYNISLFIKNINSSQSRVELFDTVGGAEEGAIEITWSGSTPSLGSYVGNASDATFKELFDGWWRVSFNSTSDSVNTTHRVFVYADRVNSSDSIYFWGAQVEQQPLPTSYIRTEGSTVSRSADDLTIDVAGNIPSTPATIHCEFDIDSLVDGGTGTPRYFWFFNAQGSEQGFNRIDVDGDIQVKYGLATNSPVGLSNYQTNESSFTFVGNSDGSGVIYENKVNASNLSSINLSVDNSEVFDIGGTSGVSSLFGSIKKLVIYDVALTAQEVALL